MIASYSPFDPSNITSNTGLSTFMGSSYEDCSITKSIGISDSLVASNPKTLTIEHTDIKISKIP